MAPVRILSAAVLCLVMLGCRADTPPPDASARSLLLVTIDTLRADRVGAYGYAPARTPTMDRLAARGVRFNRAYATSPITLPSHASLMSGRYPPGHGARHNGMRVHSATPTLARALSSAAFATGAFVGAFPLDTRFGLADGFETYGDRMPRASNGRPANERPGRLVVDEALAWLRSRSRERFFLWVHLFEPHAPYGAPGDARPVENRYDDEVAEADRQIGRLVGALGDRAASTLVVVTSDHGEAFGEHGEIGHSIFVYDTTLRVPLIIAGPGIAARTIDEPVGLIDVAPTAARLLGIRAFDADGVDLAGVLVGGSVAGRQLYAESFAPLLDFGWSPLRSIRTANYKYIAAPKPELYNTSQDAAEAENLVAREPQRASELRERVDRISPASLPAAPAMDSEASARLQALGYVSGGRPDVSTGLPDPKDRRDMARRIAQVTSGELTGRVLESALRAILAEDPNNPQAHLRLGYVLVDANRCSDAVPHFRNAIASKLPSADAHLGLAACQAVARGFDQAVATLREAERVEPDNPVVAANLGIVLSDGGRPADGVAPLQRAVSLDPEFHQARFNLAIAHARAGDRAAAAGEAAELLRRLPPDAPQRSEVERLLHAVK